jgi:O-antigen/teichoic acid export membrane protein
MFGTVSMLPVFILFLLGPTLLINLLYTGRYTEAVPILQVFSLLSFVVPFIAVGSNTLLGLGKVKPSFVVGLQVLTASLVCYFAFIPWLGALGAAWGYVAASYATGWLTWIALNRFVPITATNVLQRANDIRVFLRSRLR